MIHALDEKYPPGKTHQFPVVAINDLYEDWQGTVRFRLYRNSQMVEEKSQACTVPSLGRDKLTFAIGIPNLPGQYQLEAALVKPGAEIVPQPAASSAS